MRVAIVSTYPPRACGIGTFAADVRAGLIGVSGVARAELVAVVNEPSSPQRHGLLATIAQAVRGDYVPHGTHARAARRRRRPAPARVRHLRRPGRRVRALLRPQPLAAARGDPAYRALRADAASGGCPHRALQRGRARDRDDRDGAPAARLLGRLPRGEGACRAARSAEPAHGPCRERARRARLRRLRRHGRPVPALHVRADLGRQGSRDDDRRHARDRRAPSGGGST